MEKEQKKSRFQFPDPILPERIPEIDLYMDQVLTFLTEKLRTEQSQNTEKVLTKTMINNYSKDKLLPPSRNKKYTKEHILLLILIYHMKMTLSINDIETVTKTIYGENDADVLAIYSRFIEMQETLKQSPEHEFKNIIQILNGSDQACDKQRIIEMVLELVLEANLRKQLAEKLIELLG